jgi:hypothetical protein
VQSKASSRQRGSGSIPAPSPSGDYIAVLLFMRSVMPYADMSGVIGRILRGEFQESDAELIQCLMWVESHMIGELPSRRASIAQAIEMANDTEFGLAAFVQSTDLAHARRVARQLRAGQVNINYPDWDIYAPFGGYKQSGNGREYADWAIHDFLEVKALIGYGEAA